MRPLRLQAEGFGPYAELDLDVSAVPHAVIVGDNGLGKTFLLDIPRAALFGEGRASTTDLIRRGHTGCLVAFECEHHGHVYRVQRRIKLDAKGRASAADVLFQRRRGDGWEALEKHAIQDTLGLTPEIFDSTCFLRSYGARGLGDFSQAKAADRKAMLYTLRSLTRYATLAETARGRAGVAVSLTGETERELDALGARRRDAERAATEVSALEADLEREQADLGALEADLGIARGRLTPIGDLRSRADALQARERAQRQTLAAAHARRTDLDRQAREQEALDAGRAEVLAAVSRRAELRAQWPAADALAKHAALAIEPLRAADAEATLATGRAADRSLEADRVARTRRSRDELTRVLAGAEADRPGALAEAEASIVLERSGSALREADRAAKLLGCVPCRGEGPFAACQLLGDASGKAATLEGLRAEVLAARARMSEPAVDAATAAARLRMLDATIARARGGLETTPPPEGPDPAEAAADLARCRAAADRAGEALAEAVRVHRERQNAADAIVAEGRRLGALADRAPGLDAARQLADGLRRQIADLDATIGGIDRGLAEIRAEADAVAASVAAHEDTGREIAGLETRAAGARSRIADLRVRLGLACSVRDAAPPEERIGELRATLLRARREATAAGVLRQFYGEAPVLIVEHDLEAIRDEANTWLAKTSTLQLRFETQKTAKTSGNVKETLDVLVSMDGWERARETFSGSELFRIDLAIALGIGRALGVGAAWVAIDEGFGTLKGDTIGAVVEALSGVLPELGALWAISHVPQVAAMFPARLHVRGTANGSVVEIVA